MRRSWGGKVRPRASVGDFYGPCAMSQKHLGRVSGPLYGVPMFVAANTWHAAASFLEENVLAKIPQILHEHINTAYPANVCLVGTVLPNGFAQITPRGSTMVFDDEHIALWERGKGTTTENLTDGTPVTIFMRKPAQSTATSTARQLRQVVVRVLWALGRRRRRQRRRVGRRGVAYGKSAHDQNNGLHRAIHVDEGQPIRSCGRGAATGAAAAEGGPFHEVHYEAAASYGQPARPDAGTARRARS